MPFRLLCAVSCAAAIFAAGAAGASPPPGGIYAIIEASAADQYPIARKALRNPGVDGLLIHLRWKDISPSLMQYDWTALDQAVQVAVKAHKRSEIGIVTGAALPDWVTAPPPQGLGAKSATFDVLPVGGTCTTFTMAAPWDRAYLKAFRNLLHQLSAHLRATGAYGHLSMLKLFGITTTTDELRVPALTECSVDAVQTWISLGYTQANMETAWKAMLQDYLDEFPRKSFNIGFIGFNAFPGIAADGKVATTEEQAARISARFSAILYNDAGAAMPGRLALGFDSLVLKHPPTDKSYGHSKREFFADVDSANARPGWQTNELLGNYPGGGAACEGSSPADAVACANAREFRRMLLRGVYPKGPAGTPPGMQGVYLEVFPQNAVAFPRALAPVHASLAPWN
ncbi:MAG TPA: hypothetical protein VGM17_07535 [Rhizomicrobium sp.]|jgi:hypothetical protein